MRRRGLGLTVALPLVMIFAFAPAWSAPPQRLVYASSGTLTADRSAPPDCGNFDECAASLAASGSMTCGDACVLGAPSGGDFTVRAALTFNRSPLRLLHPPSPCIGQGNGEMDIAYPSDPMHVVLSHVTLNSLRGVLTATGTVTSGSLSGSRVRLRFSWPTDPMRGCPAGSPFTGSTTFYPTDPI